jgi:16S rRNA (cytosine967-C5)-methyltransferase
MFEGLGIDQARAERADCDWPAVWRTFQHIDRIDDPTVRFALTHSLPDWLAGRLLAEYGPADADAFARALNGRAPLTLRANLLRTTRDQLLAELAEHQPTATRWSAEGVVLGARVNVFGLPGFKAGHFEVQDEASQLVAEIVMPSGLVVDACAGAGGKTLAMGALMKNKGRLVAMDMARHKLDELVRRARRAGLSNHRTLPVPADGPLPPDPSLVGKADRVLVDAPCSGVGSMRRNPEARWRMSPEFVAALPDLQTRIALRALPLVKPGGRLVYAHLHHARGRERSGRAPSPRGRAAPPAHPRQGDPRPRPRRGHHLGRRLLAPHAAPRARHGRLLRDRPAAGGVIHRRRIALRLAV